MQVSPSSQSRRDLYPISRSDWNGDFAILHRYEKAGVQGIEDRYDATLGPNNPTHFLRSLDARPYLKDERFDIQLAAYRLGIIAARVVINQKLVKITKGNTNINQLTLPSNQDMPIDFAALKLRRFILAPLYPPPALGHNSIDIKAEVRAAIGHITTDVPAGTNDWLAIGMGDTHALYGKLWNPSREFATTDLSFDDPVLADVDR